jgi:hypothetical protein
MIPRTSEREMARVLSLVFGALFLAIFLLQGLALTG